MKNKNYLMLILFGLLCFALNSSAQTNLIVHYNDDSEHSFSIAEEGKLSFSETNLLIDEGDGNPTTVQISSIRKILFDTGTSIPSDYAQKGNVIIYPNPTRDFIRIADLNSEKINVKIFSLSGQLVLEGEYESNSPINVSQLTTGFYLMKVNKKTFKFGKL